MSPRLRTSVRVSVLRPPLRASSQASTARPVRGGAGARSGDRHERARRAPEDSPDRALFCHDADRGVRPWTPRDRTGPVAIDLGESLVAYFAALLARTEDGWDVSETELDDVETLADLADQAREAAEDDEPVLVFLEQEDVWFAVVRVDGEEDPRIFVSDAAAAARSSYGEIVLTDELLGRDAQADLDDLDNLVVDLDEDDEEGASGASSSSSSIAADDEEEEANAADADAVPAGPLGEADLLADFGFGAKELMNLAAEGALPSEALGEIAEVLGCGEVLEAVR